jgi:hypothetical protein
MSLLFITVELYIISLKGYSAVKILSIIILLAVDCSIARHLIMYKCEFLLNQKD